MNVHATTRLRTPRLAIVVMLASIVVPATLIAGCHDDKPPVTPIPNDSTSECPDAGPERCKATCADACAGLRRADCLEGFPTPGGHKCEEVCETTSDARAWPKACWAAAQTRADVLACGKTRCLKRAQ